MVSSSHSKGTGAAGKEKALQQAGVAFHPTPSADGSQGDGRAAGFSLGQVLSRLAPKSIQGHVYDTAPQMFVLEPRSDTNMMPPVDLSLATQGGLGLLVCRT